jgi:hypothetical protein
VITEPFLGTEAIARGLLTRDQVYGPRFRRVLPDVYVPAGVELDLAMRSRAAYMMVRERGGVLGGYSAALLLGAECGPRDAPAEVVVPVRTKARSGLRISRHALAAAEITSVDGCRVTNPLRTAWDLGRRLPFVEAVVAVDALAHRHGFDPAELLDRRAVTPGARGSRRLDQVVAHADPRAESPPETRLRLALVGAGLPAPTVQYRVIDEYGNVLARADLAYPEAALLIEYDGALHFTPRRARRDRRRDAELAGYGWETLRLVDDDLLGMLQTVHRVRTLLRMRGLPC